MLRCAGRHATRLISQQQQQRRGHHRVSVVAGIGDLLLRRQQQPRFVSSWLAPTHAPAAAAASHGEGGGGGSGNFGIATGLELEELEAQRKGKKMFDLDATKGPFGTKNHPAVIESAFDERIVGCSGGVGDDEHDVLWFKLKKGEEYECSLCTQVFELKVVGEGGLPGAHH